MFTQIGLAVKDLKISWSQPEQTAEQTVELPMIWYSMTPMECHWNVSQGHDGDKSGVCVENGLVDDDMGLLPDM